MLAVVTRPGDAIRRDPLLGLLLTGYIATWAAVAALAHTADRLVHQAVGHVPLVEQNAWIIGALTLAGAGAYQFTKLKYRCLDKCRSPLVFVTEHWTGRDEQRQALWLGVRHGVFCVGCCWTLMLLMFVVGVGNLAWMFALGLVMSAEKNAAWGRRLARPLGFTLLAASALTTLVAVA